MKKIILKILFIMISFVIFSIYVEAAEKNTTENQAVSNKTKNETANQATNQVSKEEQEKKPTETLKNETMYVQERCNIRESYSVDSNRVGGLDVGTEVTVIAEYSNGWYKIKYDGGTAYIKAGILRSTKPEIEEPEEQPTETPEETNQPTENESNSTLPENNDEVDNEYAELINEIGVLPEVGNNLADVLYGGAIFLAVFMLFVVRDKK